MSKVKEVLVKSGEVSGLFYRVSGRIFLTRAAALAYCRSERISAYLIEAVTVSQKVFDDAKAAADWQLSVYFDGEEPLLICERRSAVHAFTVPMSELVKLVRSIKVRARQVSKEGAL